MSDPVWYRSLYWRIAFGFIAMLAVLLLVQGLLFLWMTDRMVGASPARTPIQLADHVAADVSAQLQEHPDLDLETYVREHFKHIFQPFLVGLHDGRRGSNRPTGLPPNFDRSLYGRFRADRQPPSFPPGPAPGEASQDEAGAPRTAANAGAHRPGGVVFAPVAVNDAVVGYVAVPSGPPPVSIMLREIGPTLGWLGMGLLGIGATVTALLIFRPAHKRLRALEQAARALGEGRTDVQAIEGGGDEVSSLARTFNRMAADLAGRATALAEADRTRRQLLADVSHELMTPLTAIRGYTETLAMPDVPLDAATRSRYLTIVEQETHKLEAIIGDLLDVARFEGGGGTLTLEAVPVAHLFGRIADRHEPAVRERGIALDLHIEPGTPHVQGDAARLEQALQNLAANAIRHTPAGGRVTLRAEPMDEGVQISVRDTGPGIPPEHLPRIFDRFYKVDAARSGTSAPSGSGLGLSIVQAIVNRHGGRVSASNAPDGGALFEVRLPAAQIRPARS
jgi:two-component system OmpR family sensor kinase